MQDADDVSHHATDAAPASGSGAASVGFAGLMGAVLSMPGRAVRWFLPSAMPLMARPSYALELWTTLAFSMVVAPIEGGVVSVFAKHAFAEAVPPGVLDWFVAFLQATGELANILSFVWITASQRRPKIPFINGLQSAVIAGVVALALVPRSMAGLWILTVLVVAARVCWSGIVTIRPTIWRSNYARPTRARIVGRFQTVQVLVVAFIGVALGASLDAHPDSYRYATPVCGALGIGAVVAYARVRMRRQAKALRDEAREPVMKPWHGPRVVAEVLGRDPQWARFQMSMFILGLGNLMMNPIIVITLKERFGLGYLSSILVTSTIQSLIMPLAIPAWSKLLDRSHVVKFRSIHSWIFVVASTTMTLGAALHRVELFFVGSAMLGIAYGGGTIAWHLGHVDFAPPAETSRYMASHVTLNGARGLLAPFLAVSLYRGFNALGLDGSAWTLGAAVVVNAMGAMGFVLLRRRMGQRVEGVRRTQ